MSENTRTVRRVVRAVEQEAELGNWQDEVAAAKEFEEENDRAFRRELERRRERDNELDNVLDVANVEKGFPPTLPLDYEESSESSESSSENPERAGTGGKRPRLEEGRLTDLSIGYFKCL